jgi:hypothetical protein
MVMLLGDTSLKGSAQNYFVGLYVDVLGYIVGTNLTAAPPDDRR